MLFSNLFHTSRLCLAYLWHFLNWTLSFSLSFLHLLCPILISSMSLSIIFVLSLLIFPCVFPHPIFTVRRQALLVRALLEYSQSSQTYVLYGLSLVAGIFLMELMRSWSLALMWAVNYRTAARLRGAALTFAFQKILRLRSTKDISPGEVGDSGDSSPN